MSKPRSRDRMLPGMKDKKIEEAIEQFGEAADKPVEQGVDKRPNAPRKYKSITVPFNWYEFDKLGKACEKTGGSKLGFIKDAIMDALEKQNK